MNTTCIPGLCLQSRFHGLQWSSVELCFDQSLTQEEYKKTKEWVLLDCCGASCDDSRWIALLIFSAFLFVLNHTLVAFTGGRCMKCCFFDSQVVILNGVTKVDRESSLLNNKSYLVDPASNICLSQRLSHACLSINNFILWNCVQLIKSVIIYLMVSFLLGYP